MPIVKIKVSGIAYEIDTEYLTGESRRFPQRPGMLPEVVRNAVAKGDELVFEFSRPCDIFGSILGFYQTDQLHMPLWMCPGAFRAELEFWGIQTSYLEPCCKSRYKSFTDEQQLVSEFHNELFGDVAHIKPEAGSTSGISWKQKLWLVVDNQSQSLLARIYFAVTLIAVLVSIIGIGLGTDSCCMRAVTVCEMREYLRSVKLDGFQHAINRIKHGSCSDTDLASYFDSQDEMHFYMTVAPPPPPPPPTQSGSGGQGQSQSQGPSGQTQGDSGQSQTNGTGQQPQHPPVSETVTIPKLKRRLLMFDVIDYVTLMFFTVDFVLRLIACPSLLAFARSVVNYFDLFALVGTYMHLTITQLKKEEKYEDNWIDALEYLQVLRSLRLLRLVKNLRTSQVLVFSLRKNLKDLSILAMFLFIGVCTFGSLLYFAEERSRVVSIPMGWWWSIITMTTVGYGDIAPASGPGKIIGSMCALCGVVLLSLTLPIFVNNFLTLYQYADDGDPRNRGENVVATSDKNNTVTSRVTPFIDEKKVAV